MATQVTPGSVKQAKRFKLLDLLFQAAVLPLMYFAAKAPVPCAKNLAVVILIGWLFVKIIHYGRNERTSDFLQVAFIAYLVDGVILVTAAAVNGLAVLIGFWMNKEFLLFPWWTLIIAGCYIPILVGFFASLSMSTTFLDKEIYN